MDDWRQDERVETAEFAPARVGGRGPRRPGPVVAVIWIVALVAVVGVGIASHPAWGPDASGPPTQLPVALRPVPSHLVKSPPGVINPAPSPAVDSDLIALEIAPATRGIAVSGTVRSRSIVWVFLSLETADGAVQSWRSLSVLDGGLRPVTTPTFKVRFEMAGRLPEQAVWVEANAYNDVGRKVGTVRQQVGFGGQERIWIQYPRVK